MEPPPHPKILHYWINSLTPWAPMLMSPCIGTLANSPSEAPPLIHSYPRASYQSMNETAILKEVPPTPAPQPFEAPHIKEQRQAIPLMPWPPGIHEHNKMVALSGTESGVICYTAVVTETPDHTNDSAQNEDPCISVWFSRAIWYSSLALAIQQFLIFQKTLFF